MKILLLILVCISVAIAQAPAYSYEDQVAWSTMGSCAGSSQSPVDLPCRELVVNCPAKKSYDLFTQDPVIDYTVTSDKDLHRNFETKNSWLRFSNETNDYLYKADHIRWHSPSEHTIQGKSYDLQLHFVHKLDSTKMEQYASVGVLFQVDEALEYDSFDNIELHSAAYVEKMPFPVPLTNGHAYHYRGSNTVPPCMQNVIGFIQMQTHKITRKNLDKFKASLNGGKANNRQTQRLGARQVFLIGNGCAAGPSAPSMTM